MNLLALVRSRLNALVRRNSIEADMAEEMRLHLEQRTEENIAAGLMPAEARYAALRKFGGVEQIKEIARDQRGWAWLERLVHDLGCAARGLRRTPGFTAVAVLTLALGIGTCTAMFSIVNAVLLRPLPVHAPDRLVWIENSFGGGLTGRTSRADTLQGWREQSQSLESIAGYFAFSDFLPQTLSGAGEPERLRGVAVTGNFFSTLGVPLLHGRNFTEDECKTPGPGAIVLSHAFWQRRFGGDPSVVGRALTINKTTSTVVGVLPRSFDFDALFTPGNEVDLFAPFPITAETARIGNALFAIGRLKPDATVAQAQAELTLISERLRESIRVGGRFGAVVNPLDDALRGKFRSVFLVLAGAVACVLAIACVNLSGLLLARLNARRHEFALRVALGARRGHLVRQILTESFFLAFVGALVGVPFAVWATSALARISAFGVPLLQNATFDFAALAVTFATIALAGIACGLLPALQLSRASGNESLKNSAHDRTAGSSSVRTRDALVVIEVALACLLLVTAGLLFRSFSALLRVNLGFQPQNAMVWSIDPARRFSNGVEVEQHLGNMVRRIAALPGIEAVGLSDTLPLGRNRNWAVGAAGIDYPDGKQPIAYPRMVHPDYFRTMQIPFVAGRSFEQEHDPGAGNVVIINETLAQRLWPDGRDPLGQKVLVNDGSTVIGVVADVRHGSLEQGGSGEMYLDYRQIGDWTAMEMVVRSTRPPESLVPEVRAALAAHDPAMSNGEFFRLERVVDNAVAPRRLITRLLGFFSSLALTLAALGLYGVVAYSVVQRTREIGIRMAIGAQRADVVALVLADGLKLAGIGIALGLAGSLAVTQVLKSQLFGISAQDPATFAGIAALLLAVAVVACVLPALRAATVDPLIALRAE